MYHTLYAPQYDHYDTSYYSSNYVDGSQTDPAVVIAVLIVSAVMFLGIYALYAWFLGRVFHKAGVPKWKAWVPFYNNWTQLELGGQEGFWSVLMIIPVVNYVAAVFLYLAQYHISLKFGKREWWIILAIFVPIIWLGILAFDSSKWNGGVVVKKAKKAPAPVEPIAE